MAGPALGSQQPRLYDMLISIFPTWGPQAIEEKLWVRVNDFFKIIKNQYYPI